MKICITWYSVKTSDPWKTWIQVMIVLVTSCVTLANLFGGYLFFFLFWLHLQHMEIPGPGIESKLQL